jgi:hypothetical protein
MLRCDSGLTPGRLPLMIAGTPLTLAGSIWGLTRQGWCGYPQLDEVLAVGPRKRQPIDNSGHPH